MDAWISRMERALELIAGRLDDPPSLTEVAGAARVSPFHFHRIWRAMTGETLHSTIERLRIAAARQRLGTGKASVTEVAMEGGFGTSQSFARAFRRTTGASPTQFLSSGAGSAPVPVEHAPLRIELREGCSLVALRQEGGAYRELNPLFWQLWNWAESSRVLPGLEGIYGIPLDDPESVDETELRYDACLSLSDPGTPPAPFRVVALPAGSYAVLRHTGPYDLLEDANQRLIGQVLASGREPADRPLFHHFVDDPEEVAETDLRTDILLLLEDDAP